jgi:hypothetical protein
VATSDPEKPTDFWNDEFSGMGGSYIVDPVTSKRRRQTEADIPPAPELNGAKHMVIVSPTEILRFATTEEYETWQWARLFIPESLPPKSGTNGLKNIALFCGSEPDEGFPAYVPSMINGGDICYARFTARHPHHGILELATCELVSRIFGTYSWFPAPAFPENIPQFLESKGAIKLHNEPSNDVPLRWFSNLRDAIRRLDTEENKSGTNVAGEWFKDNKSKKKGKAPPIPHVDRAYFIGGLLGLYYLDRALSNDFAFDGFSVRLRSEMQDYGFVAYWLINTTKREIQSSLNRRSRTDGSVWAAMSGQVKRSHSAKKNPNLWEEFAKQEYERLQSLPRSPGSAKKSVTSIIVNIEAAIKNKPELWEERAPSDSSIRRALGLRK